MDSAYYALIYNFLTHKIERFAIDTMGQAISWVTSMAFILVTLWVLFRGYAMVTGQLRAPMMDTVVRLVKIALIVTAAKAMSFGGMDLYDALYKQLPRAVNQIMAGSDASPVQQIDKNLLLISAATSAIDMVQVPTSDVALADEKANTSMMAALGIGAPAMAAGAMLLLYQLAIALIVGLAPLFILCLAFDRTKDLFRRWLTYAIGTVFSMATLNWVSAIALDLTTQVAAAIWTTDALSRMTGLDAPGFNTMAFQQGGVGLLMTVLIISTPPMAAMFFSGVLGHFNPFPALGGAGSGRTRRSSGGGETPASPYHAPAAPSHTTTAPLFSDRPIGMASSAQADVIKPVNASRALPPLDEIAMARAAYGDPRFWTAQVGAPAPGTGTPVPPPATPPTTSPPVEQPAVAQSQPVLAPTPAALTADDVSVSHAPGVNLSSISDSAELILREICARANISSVTISSAARTPDSQANAMYENAQSRGLDSQRRLYGQDGNAVLDQYEQGQAQGLAPATIKENMSRVIREHPNSFHHVSRAPSLSVFDVSPSSVGDEQAGRLLAREAQADARVIRFFQPPNDPGFHFEIQDP